MPSVAGEREEHRTSPARRLVSYTYSHKLTHTHTHLLTHTHTPTVTRLQATLQSTEEALEKLMREQGGRVDQ